jgi:cbb3-type cytochrome oxidase maturation protein
VEVMFILIGFSLFVALIFLGLYLWAVRSGQYDDKVTPSIRMLFDDGTSGKRTRDNDEHDHTNKGDPSNGR